VGDGTVVLASYHYGQYVGRGADGSVRLVGTNWQGHTWRAVT
jgi:hypothetical protein